MITHTFDLKKNIVCAFASHFFPFKLNEKHKQNVLTKLDENRGVNFNKQFQQLFGANVFFADSL